MEPLGMHASPTLNNVYVDPNNSARDDAESEFVGYLVGDFKYNRPIIRSNPKNHPLFKSGKVGLYLWTPEYFRSMDHMVIWKEYRHTWRHVDYPLLGFKGVYILDSDIEDEWLEEEFEPFYQTKLKPRGIDVFFIQLKSTSEDSVTHVDFKGMPSPTAVGQNFYETAGILRHSNIAGNRFQHLFPAKSWIEDVSKTTFQQLYSSFTLFGTIIDVPVWSTTNKVSIFQKAVLHDPELYRGGDTLYIDNNTGHLFYEGDYTYATVVKAVAPDYTLQFEGGPSYGAHLGYSGDDVLPGATLFNSYSYGTLPQGTWPNREYGGIGGSVPVGVRYKLYIYEQRIKHDFDLLTTLVERCDKFKYNFNYQVLFPTIDDNTAIPNTFNDDFNGVLTNQNKDWFSLEKSEDAGYLKIIDQITEHFDL
jgi:hypothetical protein